MAIQGHLATIKIPELFSFLSQLRMTGTLFLIRERDERVFVFHEGDIVYATTTDSTQRLGNLLVRLGFLSRESLSSTLEKAVTKGVFLGEILLETSAISEEQLQNAVREQMINIMKEALSWSTGVFHFDERDDASAIPQGTRVSTRAVLLELASKEDERLLVKELFPDYDIVLVRGEGGEGGAAAALWPEEAQVLELINGQQTVEQLLFTSPKDCAFTARTLRKLLEEGRVSSSGARPAERGFVPTPDLHCLPVTSDIPGRVFSLFHPTAAPAAEIARTLSQDPILMAKALQALTLNCVVISRSSLSPAGIVDLMNPFEMRSVLIREAVRGLFFTNPLSAWKECWEHSLLCAQLTEQVALATNYLYPGEAYVAGLLHNLGAYILLARDPEGNLKTLTEAKESQGDIEALEEERFGISHTRLGGTHAERWNFPRLLVLCIKHHHKVNEKVTTPLLHMLSVAAGIAREGGLEIERCPAAARQFEISLKHLNLSRRRALALAAKLPSASLGRLRSFLAERDQLLKAGAS